MMEGPWGDYADGLWVVHRDPAGRIEATNEAMMTAKETAMVRRVLERTRNPGVEAERPTADVD